MMRIFTPFLLLLLGFALYYGLAGRDRAEGAPRIATTDATAAVSSEALAVATAVRLTAEPVASAVPDATAVPIAPLPAGALASLIGPPIDSTFPLDAAIAFYWTATYAPADGQVYGLVVSSDTTEIVAGTLESANFGSQFQLRVQPATLGLEPGSYTWDVRLLEDDGATMRWQSTSRSFAIEDSDPAS